MKCTHVFGVTKEARAVINNKKCYLCQKKMTIHKFLNILAFSILMGGQKVLTKSPDYIVEKFTRYCGDGKEQIEFMWGLDAINRAVFDEYVVRWRIQLRNYDTEKKES